jgi:hypothetical protein
VANADLVTVNEWVATTANVIANDTDPNGDYPLTLIAVSDQSGSAYLASGTSVGWSGNSAGIYQVQYTVRDSRGATAVGTLTVRVRLSSGCGTRICQ